MVRTPAPGELYRYHLVRLAWLDELVAGHGVWRARNAADLEAAHTAGEPAIIAVWRGSISSTASWNGWRRRIGGASGTCSSCIARRTTSATLDPEELRRMHAYWSATLLLSVGIKRY
jgi:hypothetical protein